MKDVVNFKFFYFNQLIFFSFACVSARAFINLFFSILFLANFVPKFHFVLMRLLDYSRSVPNAKASSSCVFATVFNLTQFAYHN